MIRVWEYDVADDAVHDFERAYGADGLWARLFSSASGFGGTELFVSLSRPGRYITVDRFSDQAAWRRFQAEHHDAYVQLDAETERLTLDERELVGPDLD